MTADSNLIFFFFSFPGDRMHIDDDISEDLNNSNSPCVLYVTIKSSRQPHKAQEELCLASVLISVVFPVVF